MSDWPGEIRPPKVYGNFKPSKTEREKAKRTRKSAQERREGNSDLHLAIMRQCPCVVSLKAPAGEIHHLKQGLASKERGMGMRATDRWGLPLSHDLHMDLESYGSRRETEWFGLHGLVDPDILADSLWNIYPKDVETYTKVIYAHRSAGPKI